MTVDTTIPIETLDYLGPGVYSFSFKAYDPQTVRVTGIKNGMEAEWTYNSDYTVTLGASGGTITTQPAIDEADMIQIYRQVPLAQPTDWVNQGPFSQELLEADLDRVVMQIQQLAAKIDMGLLTVWRGDWTADTLYRTRDMVINGDSVFMCIVEHTSSTSFDDDYQAGYWSLVFQIPDGTRQPR